MLLAAMLLVAGPASVSAVEPAVTQEVDVTLSYGAPSLTATDTLLLDASTSLSAPAEYFEVRLRVFRPSGALLYQKTEVRHDVDPGGIVVGFERDLADLSVSPGRYRIEVRVLASGAEQTFVNSRMLIIEDDVEPLSVVIIPRLTCSPALDPEGRFALDPATHDRQRQAIDELIALVSGRSESMTVAIPPLLLDEWSRIADGYQLTGPEGVVEVTADAETPQAYAGTLEALARAVQTGRIELLDVPFAEPDIGGLEQIDALDDLARHYALGRSTYETVLEETPSVGTGVYGDLVSAPAAKVMAETDHSYLVLSSLSQTGSASTGVYRESKTGTVSLITDAELASLLSSGTAEQLYDHLYDALTADEAHGALVVTMDIGPGEELSPNDVRRLIDIVDSVSWLEPIPAARAAQFEAAETVELIESSPQPAGAPLGYWRDVAEARKNALGLVQAWGPEDEEGTAALFAALVSESRCWAGPDLSYPFADRGRAFSASAIRLGEEVFAGVTVEMRDVTLAGRTGDVPLTITSTADRELTLQLEIAADGLGLKSTEETTAIEPGDNFITIPVDLGTRVSDSLTVRVLAGDVLISDTTVDVKASYLDRLTTVATVVIVLIGLLVFIRRRVNAADAGNMPEEADKSDDEAPTDD